MNISLELNRRNREALGEYLKLLILRNEKMKNEQAGVRSARVGQGNPSEKETIAFLVTEKDTSSDHEGVPEEGEDHSGS